MNDQNSFGHQEILYPVTSSNEFTRMAEDYCLQGRYQEAIDICRKGLEKMPDALRGRLILGKCYLEKGMIAEAKQELEKVAQSIEECLSVYKLLSQVYLEEKNMHRASEVIQKAYDLSPGEEKTKKELTPPDMAWPRQTTNTISASGEPDIREESDRRGQSFQDDQTHQVIQTDTLAEIYIKQGHLEKAFSIYQEILARQPGNTYVQEKYEALRKQMETQRQKASNQRMIPKLERWLAVVAPKSNLFSP